MTLPDALEVLHLFRRWHEGFREPRPPVAAVSQACAAVAAHFASLPRCICARQKDAPHCVCGFGKPGDKLSPTDPWGQ